MNDELIHYGVKGMKWGVRKEYVPHPRKPGAKIEPSGRKGKKFKAQTSNSTKKMQSSRQRTPEEERAYQRRVKAAKFLMAAGVLTVGAVVAHKLYKKRGHEFCDTIIKPGQATISRVTTNPNEKLDRIYGAYKEGDKSFYRSVYGTYQKVKTGTKSYAREFDIKNTLRAPSDKKARDMFQKLYDNDPEFRRNVKSAFDSYSDMMKKEGINKQYQKYLKNPNDTKALYDTFNFVLTGKGTDARDAAANKYFDLLKSNGYNALKDVNDRKFSGAKAADPLIIFDMSNLVERSVKELDLKSAPKDLAKMEIARDGEEAVAAMLGITAGVYGAKTYAEAPRQDQQNKKRGKNNG